MSTGSVSSSTFSSPTFAEATTSSTSDVCAFSPYFLEKLQKGEKLTKKETKEEIERLERLEIKGKKVEGNPLLEQVNALIIEIEKEVEDKLEWKWKWKLTALISFLGFISQSNHPKIFFIFQQVFAFNKDSHASLLFKRSREILFVTLTTSAEQKAMMNFHYLLLQCNALSLDENGVYECLEYEIKTLEAMEHLFGEGSKVQWDQLLKEIFGYANKNNKFLVVENLFKVLRKENKREDYEVFKGFFKNELEYKKIMFECKMREMHKKEELDEMREMREKEELDEVESSESDEECLEDEECPEEERDWCGWFESSKINPSRLLAPSKWLNLEDLKGETTQKKKLLINDRLDLSTTDITKFFKREPQKATAWMDSFLKKLIDEGMTFKKKKDLKDLIDKTKQFLTPEAWVNILFFLHEIEGCTTLFDEACKWLVNREERLGRFLWPLSESELAQRGELLKEILDKAIEKGIEFKFIVCALLGPWTEFVYLPVGDKNKESTNFEDHKDLADLYKKALSAKSKCWVEELYSVKKECWVPIGTSEEVNKYWLLEYFERIIEGASKSWAIWFLSEILKDNDISPVGRESVQRLKSEIEKSTTPSSENKSSADKVSDGEGGDKADGAGSLLNRAKPPVVSELPTMEPRVSDVEGKSSILQTEKKELSANPAVAFFQRIGRGFQTFGAWIARGFISFGHWLRELFSRKAVS